MPTADNSYAAYIARRKGFLLAQSKALNPTAPEQGPIPPSMDQSTYIARVLGQNQYRVQPAVTLLIEEPCCEPPTPVRIPDTLPPPS